MNFRLSLILFVIMSGVLACAQDKNPTNPNYTHEVVVEGLRNPWGFVFLPDNSMLITEKTADLFIIKMVRKLKLRMFQKLMKTVKVVLWI